MSSFAWTPGAVREALGLRTEREDEDIAYSGISTDSRLIAEGALYLALRGEHFDGHDFVAEAFARGAAGAVVSRSMEVQSCEQLYPVDDTLVALGALAAYRRQALDVPVVAITGSSGKTSTKDLARAAVGEVSRVHATSGNFNNRIGMPLTLLATPSEVEVVILELGSNEPGEIATLAAIAQPDIGVVTTIGESHLEKLGSLKGVLEEKLDLLRAVTDSGTCVVGDEPATLVDGARVICPSVRVAGWGERADAEFRPQQVEVDVFGGHRFHWHGESVTLALPGRHSVANAMIALAIAELVGVAPKDAVKGIASAEPGSLRGEIRRIGSLTVVVDCYNANPQSVRAALDLLHGQSAASRTVAVLGTMLELGESAPRLHNETFSFALGLDIDLIVATGEFVVPAASSVDGAGMTTGTAASIAGADRVLYADDWQSAYPLLRERLDGDEVVLLKASRGVALEDILPSLERDFGAQTPSPTAEA
jgi:UDP-N-acetylmuramoyl-tripeptide--D-alanyl-D-alanine ligase